LPLGESRGAVLAQMLIRIAVRSLLCAGWLIAGHPRAASAAVTGAPRSLRPSVRRCQADPRHLPSATT